MTTRSSGNTNSPCLTGKALPIIYVYRGFYQNDSYPRHLLLSIYQAKRSNADSQIFLLGNLPPPDLPFLTHVDIAPYTHSAIDFEKKYFHLAPNPAMAEELHISHGFALTPGSRKEIGPYSLGRTRFERWFILRDFAKASGIEDFFHLDPDVLLFCNVTEEAIKHAQYDCAAAGDPDSSQWPCFFVRNSTFLEQVCDGIIRTFDRDGKIWPAIAERTGFSTPYRKLESLTDTMVIATLRALNRGKMSIHDLSMPDQGEAFDTAMSAANSCFETIAGVKSITWESGRPQTRISSSREVLTMKSLHFNERTKELIPDFLDQSLAGSVSNN